MLRVRNRIVTILVVSGIALIGLVLPGLTQGDIFTVNLPIITKTWDYQPKLTICLGQEPDTLYLYGTGMMASDSVLEAVYDGPIDSETYAYQPIILEKIPSLADGDAEINSITVTAGDLVVDDNGGPITLAAGSVVRPAGCRSSDCAITYSGTGTLQMDQMSVTFQILPGIRWSDGVAVTAADSVYSYNLAGDPNTPAGKYVFERTASYVAMNATTTNWVGLPGYLDATYYLNFWQPLPEHIWGAYTAAELLTAEVSSQRPMGWGAYIIDSWTPGVNILLHRNPNYFRSWEGLPRFNQLEFRFVGQDSNANITALLTGECDILDQITGVIDQTELLLSLDAAGLVTIENSISTTWEHADFGIQHISYDDGYDIADGDRYDFFSDVRMRQAIAMCVDRQAVVDTVYYGLSEVLNTMVDQNHPLYNPAVPVYPYDPIAAGVLLDAIGWIDADGDPGTPRVSDDVEGIPDGTPLQFYYETTSATQRMAATQIMAESALACGIRMDLGYYPASEWFADGPDGKLFGRKFDLGQFAWLSGITPPCSIYLSEQTPGDPAQTWIPIMDPAAGPQDFPSGWGGQNETGYYNPAYDAACEAAIMTLYGEAGYESGYNEVLAIFSEDLPVIPLYMRNKVSASGPTITGYDLDPTEQDMWNIEAFDR